jgi:transcriptional regulator with XRE-family HTH domain
MSDEIFDILVGKNISRMRGKFGLTQEELARALGISLQETQDYEIGINPIPPAKLFQLSGLFHCSVDSLFGAEKPHSL